MRESADQIGTFDKFLRFFAYAALSTHVGFAAGFDPEVSRTFFLKVPSAPMLKHKCWGEGTGNTF